jgi:hypothetical protein
MNIVFMGMGEPFANYDATWTAVERMHDDIGISARHLTISTVGILPGIRRLTGERLPVNLAVSLHAATDALRNELVPINRRYPLADLEAACAAYLAAKGRRLSFEWALIDSVNDGTDQAEALADLCRRLPLPAHVNLIPLNPTPGYPVRGTPPAGVRAFRDRLRQRGVNATVRATRGVDIEAACGQLRAAHEAKPIARHLRPGGAAQSPLPPLGSADEDGAALRVTDGFDETLGRSDTHSGPDDGPVDDARHLRSGADDRLSSREREVRREVGRRGPAVGERGGNGDPLDAAGGIGRLPRHLPQP